MESGELLYARLSVRLRAMTTDLLVVIGTMVCLVMVGSAIPVLREGRGLGLSVMLFVLLYEPVTVSFWGGTIGHRRNNLRVQREADGRNLGLVRAIVRWAAKGFLGVLSVVSMAASHRAQTLHDVLTASVVVAVDPARAPRVHFVSESEPTPFESEIVHTIPVWRRLLVSVLYLPLPFAAGVIPTTLVVSEGCLMSEACTSEEDLWWSLGTLVWIAGSVLVLWLGWKGRLLGARGEKA